eukprot:4588795-Prymnesium_polylepis.1
MADPRVVGGLVGVAGVVSAARVAARPSGDRVRATRAAGRREVGAVVVVGIVARPACAGTLGCQTKRI